MTASDYNKHLVLRNVVVHLNNSIEHCVHKWFVKNQNQISNAGYHRKYDIFNNRYNSKL